MAPLFILAFLLLFAALWLAATVYLVTKVQASWTFEHQGRQILVQRRFLRTQLTIDGQRRKGTWSQRGPSWDQHVVTLGGKPLYVRTLYGPPLQIRAWTEDGPVFDSQPAILDGPPAPRESRREASRELVARLQESADPEVVARASELGPAIDRLLAQIEEGQRAEQLHGTLGDSEEVRLVVRGLEETLAPLLDELRSLHLLQLSAPLGAPTRRAIE